MRLGIVHQGKGIRAAGLTRSDKLKEGVVHIIVTCCGFETWHSVALEVEFSMFWMRVRFHRSGGMRKIENPNTKKSLVLRSSEMQCLAV